MNHEEGFDWKQFTHEVCENIRKSTDIEYIRSMARMKESLLGFQIEESVRENFINYGSAVAEAAKFRIKQLNHHQENGT